MATHGVAHTGSPLAALFRDPLADAAAALASPRLHRAAARALLLTSIAFAALVLAVAGYVSFWWAYVPERGLRKAVWLQYGDGRPPYAYVDLSPAGDFVATGQVYDVSLDLAVPVSERNLDLGNFMVRLSLLSPLPANATLYSASRPASLSYVVPSSGGLLGRPLALLSPPSRSVQRLSVPLMTREVVQRSGRARRVGGAAVEVGRRDAYAGGAPREWGELQVYEAVLRFDAHFEGLKWIMYHHPVSSFVVFTSAFLACELFAALAAWALFARRTGTLAPLGRSPPGTSEPPSGHGTGVARPATLAARRKMAEADRRSAAEARDRRAEAALRSRPGMEELEEEAKEDSSEEEAPGLVSAVGGPGRGEAGSDDEKGWEALGAEVEPRTQVKDEEVEGEEGTVGGSETTVTGTSSMGTFRSTSDNTTATASTARS